MDFLHNSGHNKFDFKDIEDVKEKLTELGQQLPFADDFSILFNSVKLSSTSIPNSFAVQPMEGCDASREGVPQELTFRRYRRFAAGGAGLIWMEATAVDFSGKANPRQLMIKRDNFVSFQKLRNECLQEAANSMGEDHQPLLVLQLTHSGRYSKPHGYPEPIIAHHSKVLDQKHNISDDYPLISDSELDTLQQKYIDAAGFAVRAGFKAVDIKACHGYLLNEILAAHTRENSKYGGSFANRSRFIKEVVAKIKEKYPDLIICTRLNVYDAIPYPYGFGMATDGSMEPDLTEPVLLIKELADLGVEIVNIAVGNPYYNPHVERPFDAPVNGGYIPEEHPLENIGENMKITREINQAVSSKVVTVASGLSWFRQFIPDVAAGLKKEKWADIIGLGRAPFAYPDLFKDLKEKGYLEKSKTCISCSSCTQMMRDGMKAGCPVRDSEVYAPIYQEGRERNKEYVSRQAEICRDCSPASCREDCPADVDIPAFIRATALGNDRQAYNILRKSNTLPEVCAYLCPVEAQCEGACVQNNIGSGAVSIQKIQRYVARKARLEGWSNLNIKKEKPQKVAVLGAGPAGLSCTIKLLEQGYQVDIYDQAENAGGIASKVIPEDRLKNDIFQKEIMAILGDVSEERLKWKFGSTLGENISFNTIVNGYDAVFLGLGLQATSSLPVKNTRPAGIFDALDFLEKIKNDRQFQLPDKVAVIGGGNTAMDAALQAAKGLDKETDVYLLYRRSFQQMPAWPAERENCLEAGVHFLILQQPVDYLADENGNLTGIKLVRTELGKADASGRRSPQPIPDSEYILEVSMVVEALGQRLSDDLLNLLQEKDIEIKNGLVKTGADSTATSREGIFAGGDLINGGQTVVRAIFEGYQAADEIHNYIKKSR